MKLKSRYLYCIFYLEKKHWRKIPDQLKEAGYKGIKCIVPTVNVLRKTSRGKMVFEDHPVLFNFGFIRIPRECAYSRPYLNKMRKKIAGIHSWLKDTQTLHPRKKKIRIDNPEDFDDFSIVATATRKQVIHYNKISRENKKYSLDDLVNVKPGQYITLRGYPYEGQGATIKEVNYKNRTIKVEVLILSGKLEILLPFDNVLYSVYMNYDPDNLQAGDLEGRDPEDITQDDIDNFYKTRQY